MITLFLDRKNTYINDYSRGIEFFWSYNNDGGWITCRYYGADPPQEALYNKLLRREASRKVTIYSNLWYPNQIKYNYKRG